MEFNRLFKIPKGPQPSPKLKFLAECMALTLCMNCKDSLKEILNCDGRLEKDRCGVFELRRSKARFKQLLMALKGNKDEKLSNLR